MLLLCFQCRSRLSEHSLAYSGLFHFLIFRLGLTLHHLILCRIALLLLLLLLRTLIHSVALFALVRLALLPGEDHPTVRVDKRISNSLLILLGQDIAHLVVWLDQGASDSLLLSVFRDDVAALLARLPAKHVQEL